MTSNTGATGVASQLILVVEDEERLARVVLDYLEAAGFRTHWNALGEDAVAAARKMEPSLVLLDLNLPDVDGLLVCRRMRETGRRWRCHAEYFFNGGDAGGYLECAIDAQRFHAIQITLLT